MPNDTIQSEIFNYFEQLVTIAKNQEWKKDSQWTIGINEYLADLGHKYGYIVHASRCKSARASEWLYDHHWREYSGDNILIRIPLVLEIEWGFGNAGMFEKILHDFLKLVQARADLRVMVFQGNGIDNMTDSLIQYAKHFTQSQTGDKYIFAGYGWDTKQMHCRLWSRP